MKNYRPSAGIVLLNNRNEVFCGKRFATGHQTPHAEEMLWQMPQGGIEVGETPQEAAKRELFEETGIQGAEIIDEYPEWISYDFPEYIKQRSFGGRFDGQTQKWFLMRIHAADGTEVRLNHSVPPEFEDWAWLSPQEVLHRVIQFRKEVYRSVFEHFSLIKP